MLLVLRLVLVPLLIAAVTLASRRWGHRVGAFVTALPAVAGPTLGFYAVQQGPLFAADAARGSLLGLVGVAAFCLVYARASARFHWSVCLLLGWASFAIVTVLMYRVHVGPRRRLPHRGGGANRCEGAFAVTRTRTAGLRHTAMGPAAANAVCRGAGVHVDGGGRTTGFERERNPHAVPGRDGHSRRLHPRAAWIGGVHRIPADIHARVVRFGIFCVTLALTLPHLPIAAAFGVSLVTQLVLQTALFRGYRRV